MYQMILCRHLTQIGQMRGKRLWSMIREVGGLSLGICFFPRVDGDDGAAFLNQLLLSVASLRPLDEEKKKTF